MRIGLLDECVASPWQSDVHRFAPLALHLADAGHEVVLFHGRAELPEGFQPSSRIALCPLERPAMPIIAGSTRLADVDPLVASYGAQFTARRFRLDCLVAPLRGGVAAGILMARACAEAFENMRVILLADGTSLQQAEKGADPAGDLSCPVADALERICVKLADTVVAVSPEEANAAAALVQPGAPNSVTYLPELISTAPVKAHDEMMSEIAYLGPFTHADGAPAFIQAIENLARRGILGSRLVTFLGPIADTGGGLSRKWIGLRALQWDFRFQVCDVRSRKAALAYAGASGRFAVMRSDWGDLARIPSPGAILSFRADDPSVTIAAALEHDLERAIRAGGADRLSGTIDWGSFAKLVAATEPKVAARATAGASVSLCILHHNRSGMLPFLLDSIPREIEGQPVEILIIDNASTPEHRTAVEALASDAIRLVLIDEPLDPCRAYMRGIHVARHTTVLLCDDDNLFAQDGVVRLAKALRQGTFDIVVSSLHVFDNAGDAPTKPVALTTFIGQAHTAGLFFNFFGDTAMGFARDAFIAAGGFAAEAGSCPCFDWTTLARMQAAGLSIGVLQDPAILYRRNERGAADRPEKLDQAGARALVFKAYRGKYVAALTARIAQNTLVDLF